MKMLIFILAISLAPCTLGVPVDDAATDPAEQPFVDPAAQQFVDPAAQSFVDPAAQPFVDPGYDFHLTLDTAITKAEQHDLEIETLQQEIRQISDVLEKQNFVIQKLQDLIQIEVEDPGKKSNVQVIYPGISLIQIEDPGKDFYDLR